MTLAEATAYLSTLEAAMLSGELSVRLPDGRAITYQSLPDMERTAACLAPRHRTRQRDTVDANRALEPERHERDELLTPTASSRSTSAQLPTASYQAGETSQYHKNPGAVGSGDRSVATAYYRLRDWSRWLDENLDIVTGAFDKLVNFIVGPGLTIEPTVRDRKGKLLPRVNDQIRRAIVDESYPDCWSRDCNVTGEYTRGEQERIACRSWLRDGEILGRKVPRQIAAGRIPHQVQLIEADYLAFEILQSNRDGTAIIHGVEKDEWGRPTAYHIYRQNPVIVSDFRWATGLDAVRVSADEIGHLKFLRRANQTRGVPICHAAILRLDDIAEYEDSHRLGAQGCIAACRMDQAKPRYVWLERRRQRLRCNR